MGTHPCDLEKYSLYWNYILHRGGGDLKLKIRCFDTLHEIYITLISKFLILMCSVNRT